jgi:hypothetical protein
VLNVCHFALTGGSACCRSVPRLSCIIPHLPSLPPPHPPSSTMNSGPTACCVRPLRLTHTCVRTRQHLLVRGCRGYLVHHSVLPAWAAPFQGKHHFPTSHAACKQARSHPPGTGPQGRAAPPLPPCCPPHASPWAHAGPPGRAHKHSQHDSSRPGQWLQLVGAGMMPQVCDGPHALRARTHQSSLRVGATSVMGKQPARKPNHVQRAPAWAAHAKHAHVALC